MYKKSVMHFGRALKAWCYFFTRIFLDTSEKCEMKNNCCTRDRFLVHPFFWSKSRTMGFFFFLFLLVLAVYKWCIACYHTVVLGIIGKLTWLVDNFVFWEYCGHIGGFCSSFFCSQLNCERALEMFFDDYRWNIGDLAYSVNMSQLWTWNLAWDSASLQWCIPGKEKIQFCPGGATERSSSCYCSQSAPS